MTSDEPIIGAEPPAHDGGASPADAVRAVMLGLRDTWHAMVEEGRRGARETFDRRWREFDRKTKNRRHRDN